MKPKEQHYDIVGDIHGHADSFRTLLAKLNYDLRDGIYSNPDRKMIFVGDFIDRGPKIREVLQIVRAMVDAGRALAVIGNHEWNAIRYHTPFGESDHLRSHTEEDGKNEEQHRATIKQLVEPHPEEWMEWLAWFKTLPLFLDLGGLRVVHAAWCPRSIGQIGARRFEDDTFLHGTARTGQAGYAAVKTLLSGPELDLPPGETFTDPKGGKHRDIRLCWFCPRKNGKPPTYRSLVFPPSDSVPDKPVDESLLADAPYYDESEPPVVFGHYWLSPAKPVALPPNVACVDYSVAKAGGKLVAYRWDGERVFDRAKFVEVARQEVEE